MMEEEKNSQQKPSPWRNVVAGTVSVAMIVAVLLLISAKKRDFSDSFLLPPEPVDFTKMREHSNTREYFWDRSRHKKPPLRLRSIPLNTQNKADGTGLEITSGDIIGQNSGGRELLPDGSTAYGEDQRAWFDARFPLVDAEKFRLYGAGTLGWDTANIAEAADALSRENLSYGGGFGFSFKLSDNTELLFDYRLSRPLDSNSLYDTNSAAGFSIKLSF